MQKETRVKVHGTVWTQIAADVASVLGTVNANHALQSFGSGGRDAVNTQVAAWKKRLAPPN
jgi:hypothetical protein